MRSMLVGGGEEKRWSSFATAGSAVADLIDDLLGVLDGGWEPSGVTFEDSVRVEVGVGIGVLESATGEVRRPVTADVYTAFGVVGELNGEASQMPLSVDWTVVSEESRLHCLICVLRRSWSCSLRWTSSWWSCEVSCLRAEAVAMGGTVSHRLIKSHKMLWVIPINSEVC
jgi:hypothetical protein